MEWWGGKIILKHALKIFYVPLFSFFVISYLHNVTCSGETGNKSGSDKFLIK